MGQYEWPANDYAIGSYIQATIADEYLPHLKVKPTDHILDIGCGDGSYSTKIIQKVPEGTYLGLDRSENMLQLAQEKTAVYPNFSVQQADVLTMNFDAQFDYIVSFWCLQWCPDLKTAYMNIFRALKKGGKILTIIPAGDDPLVNGLRLIKATRKFPSLRDFKTPVDFQKVAELPNIIGQLPFEDAEVKRVDHLIQLPSLDVFRKFVSGLAFFNGQVPDDEISELNEALVEAYELECKEKYRGVHWFNISIYVVTAEKK